MAHTKSKLIRLAAVLLSFQAAVSFTNAQLKPNTELFRELKLADEQLFEKGFNQCDVALFGSLIADDFEFYHDRAGVTETKQKFIADFRDGLCNAENRSKTGYRSTRVLIAGSMTIFPLYNNGVLYGAVQNGRHRFYEQTNGRPRRLASTARFMHLWRLDGGVWKLARSVSFDHLAAPEKKTRRRP